MPITVENRVEALTNFQLRDLLKDMLKNNKTENSYYMKIVKQISAETGFGKQYICLVLDEIVYREVARIFISQGI